MSFSKYPPWISKVVGTVIYVFHIDICLRLYNLWNLRFLTIQKCFFTIYFKNRRDCHLCRSHWYCICLRLYNLWNLRFLTLQNFFLRPRNYSLGKFNPSLLSATLRDRGRCHGWKFRPGRWLRYMVCSTWRGKVKNWKDFCHICVFCN